MIVTLITDDYGIVNKNAIVLLTFNQKYYGLMLLYEYRLSGPAVFVSILFHFLISRLSK